MAYKWIIGNKESNWIGLSCHWWSPQNQPHRTKCSCHRLSPKPSMRDYTCSEQTFPRHIQFASMHSLLPFIAVWVKNTGNHLWHGQLQSICGDHILLYLEGGSSTYATKMDFDGQMNHLQRGDHLQHSYESLLNMDTIDRAAWSAGNIHLQPKYNLQT